MSIIKLQLGLTDVLETENFVYDKIEPDLEKPNLERIRYNILKQSTNDEKAVLEWQLNVDLPAVQNAIETWEHIIRRPHLAMIQFMSEQSYMLPTYHDIEINLDFVNLIPLPTKYKLFTQKDFENLIFSHSRQFGELMFSTHALYHAAGYEHEETAEYAIYMDTLEYYNPDAIPVAIPQFKIDFFLTRPSIKSNRPDFRTIKFLEKHKEEIESLGIDKDRFLQTYGRLKAGTLLTDPLDAYNAIKQYPRVCRTSIVKTEE